MSTLLLFIIILISTAFCAEQRIVGGSAVSISDYPHVLSLRVSGSHSCMASLISSTRAVTVAHCCGSPIGTYSLLGGTSDHTTTNCGNCRLFDLTNIDIHPNYDENGNGFPNDVAVLSFLAQSQNGDFQAINLAQPSNGDFAGDRCVITGWGLQQQGGRPSILLQGASMTVMTNSACAGVWGALSINDGHICITDTNSGACNGDSGAPLECSGLLAGMISWVHVTCSPTFPSVCTRISQYYSWIIAQ